MALGGETPNSSAMFDSNLIFLDLNYSQHAFIVSVLKLVLILTLSIFPSLAIMYCRVDTRL